VVACPLEGLVIRINSYKKTRAEQCRYLADAAHHTTHLQNAITFALSSIHLA